MKTLNILNSPKFLMIAALAALVFTSCEKDDKDDEPSDYIGVWVTEKKVASEDGIVEVQDVVNFSQNTFVEIASIKDDLTDEWIDVVGRKGKMTVKNGKMDVTITEIGYTSVDDFDYPTGFIVYYKEGTEEFDDLLVELEMSQEYEALYTISSDKKLTLKADDNDNGSFDEDEVNIFIRK